MHRQQLWMGHRETLALVLSASAAVGSLGCEAESASTQLDGPRHLEMEPGLDGASDSELRALEPTQPELDMPAATELDDAGSIDPEGSINPEDCWQLPAANRARLYAAPGRAADLEGG